MLAIEDETTTAPLKRRSYRTTPGNDAHAAWAASGWPSVAGAFASEPLEPFYSHADSVQLGQMTVQYSSGSGRILSRLADQVRDGLDALVVGIQFDAPIDVLASGRTRQVPTGAVLLLDLAQPARITMPANRSIELAIPRTMAEAYVGAVRRLHGRVIGAKKAALLVNHLQSLRGTLATIEGEQSARLARILLELLAVALGHGDQPVRRAKAPARRPPGQLRRDVEVALAEPTGTIAGICRDFGLSRSTLSRLFKDEGGVEAHRRGLRLSAVRTALLDPTSTERIGALAERWGFSDASHLSRAFRARYGVTPSAMRAAAATADPPDDTLVPGKLTRSFRD